MVHLGTVPYGVLKLQVEKSVTSTTRLTKADWIRAAISAVEHGGIAGIAVEPIATALGTTKGSFYWHFANRDELIAAVMEQWEELATNMVIASVAEVTDPMDRLRQLLKVVFGNEREDRIEARIVLAPFDERVSPTVNRVTALRLEFLVSLFRGLGFSRSTAAKRSRIAYAAYLGHLRLALDDQPTTSIAVRPSPAATKAYAQELLNVLTSSDTPSAGSERVVRLRNSVHERP
jgi:AcrR family transcriptional regulator